MGKYFNGGSVYPDMGLTTQEKTIPESTENELYHRDIINSGISVTTKDKVNIFGVIFLMIFLVITLHLFK